MLQKPGNSDRVHTRPSLPRTLIQLSREVSPLLKRSRELECSCGAASQDTRSQFTRC